MSDKEKNGYGYDDDEVEIMTLEFEEGDDIECEVMGVFEVDGKEYIALFATDGSDEVYLYRYKELDDDENDCELIDIEDDEEYDKVCSVFEDLTDDGDYDYDED